MHELSLVKDLVAKASSVAHEHQDVGVRSVTVRVGGLSPISEEVLREHFKRFALGTPIDGAELLVEHGPALEASAADEHAGDLILTTIELEES